MKYNTSAKSVYEVFSTENPRYVRLAIDALDKESKNIAILKKKYGSNYDGIGGVRFFSYAEDELLKCALRRLDSYIPAIKVLVEVYKETDEQVLNRFHKHNDVQIINMIHNLSKEKTHTINNLLSSKHSILTTFKATEELLIDALEHVENFEYKRIYMYYYGIARSKMDMETILKLFPGYNETKVKKVILEVQDKLPDYIKIEREKEKHNIIRNVKIKKTRISSITKSSTPKSGLRKYSLFEYFFDDNDTIEMKSEKREIVLDYIELIDLDKVQLIKKIFGESYNQLDPNIELSKNEKLKVNDLRVKIRKYIERILSVRHQNKGKVYKDDRVIFTIDNGFKESLNDYFKKKSCPLAMDIFAHYLSVHEETRNYFSKFYDLDTMNLKPNVYSSKNDAKTLKAKVKEINDYIKVCSSISRTFREKLVNYFKKPFMSDARVQLVYELTVKCIETLSDKEQLLLKELYGEDYKLLNIYADITLEDIELIKQLIQQIGDYISHSLEMFKTYKENIFMYFHKPGMSVVYKEKLDAEISRFIDDSSSKGKYVAVMLYGSTYSKLDSTVNLSKEQEKLFDSLLDEIGEHIKSVESTLKKRRKKSIVNFSFLDYFVDPNGRDEENRIIIEETKKVIDNDNSKYKTLFLKFYDDNYNFNSSLEITKEEKLNIRYYQKYIYIKVFGNGLPKSIYDMAINGRTNDARKIRIIEETDKFIQGIGDDVKNILRKVYGADFHSFNSEANLTKYELYIINRFNHELNNYILGSVPFVRTKKSISDDYVKMGNCKLPKKFFSFLSEVKTDMTLEELTKDAEVFVKKSKSKNVLAAKKLYGEELLELDESITPTEEEIKSIRFLIRDVKSRYRIKMMNKSLKDIPAVLKLPENLLDNFNISYNDTNKNMIINRINFNISARDSIFSRILHDNYGDNLTENKSDELPITASDLALFKASLKVVNNQFTKDMTDYNLKEDLLDYIYTDKSNREQLIINLTERIDALNSPAGLRFKRLIKFMYNDNFKLIRPMPLRDYEIVSFEKIIKSLSKKRKQPLKVANPRSRKSINTNFFDNFLFEGEEVVPESRKSMIVKIVRGSKAAGAKLALDLFGVNLDQECRDIELYKANKIVMNALIKMLTKRVTNTYSRSIFMLADNFIEQYYLETDTPEIKESIRKYLVKYLSSSQSKYMSIVNVAYDENYNLRKDYEFDGDKRSYYSFVYSIKLAVDKYRKKLINGDSRKKLPKKKTKVKQNKPIKLDMMDLGKNGYLALTNDLFDIQLIGNGEIQIKEPEVIDDVITNAYNELMDSKTIMDLLMISSDTLIDFYLNHIDDLEDPTEAFNYLINLGDKDIIKRLMISPLFLRVVNYLSDIERQVIYLKLVQVSNETLSDEIIAKITNVDINSISEYKIMTKEDKVNALNNFIIKRK